MEADGCIWPWYYAAARKGLLWRCFVCISRLHWAASELVHYMYIEENALLSELEMLGVGFKG